MRVISVAPCTSKPAASCIAKRRSAERLGRDAEDLVASGWEGRGFNILARRLRTGAGEIDLVVANAETLVFVEVKARRSMAEAAYSLSARQQARLLEAAGLAMAGHPHWGRNCTRFDVALVYGGRVELIEDAILYH